MTLILFKDQAVAKVEKDISGDVVSSDPKQVSQLMYAGHDDTIKAGIWESSAGVFRADYDGIFEFCHVLEGSGTIRTDDGKEFTVQAGDGFTLDAELKTEWTFDTHIRKHFVICKV